MIVNATTTRNRAAAFVCAGLVFAVLMVMFSPGLVDYHVPWTGLARGLHADVYSMIAWSLRPTVVVFAVLLGVRMWRLAGGRTGSPGGRFTTTLIHAVLLGAMVFVLLLPGSDDLITIAMLPLTGIAAVVFSLVGIRATRVRRVAEGIMSWLLLALGCYLIGLYVFFVMTAALD